MRVKITPDQLGVISDAETYPLGKFKVLVGVGNDGMRKMKQQGLKVIRTGSRCFVRGKDFSEFLGTLAADGDAQNVADA